MQVKVPTNTVGHTEFPFLHASAFLASSDGTLLLHIRKILDKIIFDHML